MKLIKRLICRLFGHKFEMKYFNSMKFITYCAPAGYHVCSRCDHGLDYFLIQQKSIDSDIVKFRYKKQKNLWSPS